MSAIGAIVGCGGYRVGDPLLARMESALRIYGPDRSGRRALDGAGLVAAMMLGFTPEDRHERQPLLLGERWHMVFAGWISNRAELLDTLGIRAEQARSLPDSAVALRAWEKWRSGAPAHLDGSFAFIVWDSAEHCLFAARSILYAPPLCYHRSRDRLAVATAPKGIFALGDVSPELDLHKIADGLVLNHSEAERSYYRGISRLPLGSTLSFDGERLSVERYYDPDAAPDIRFSRDEDYVEAAREHLDRAVANHLRAVETPAISLSSGLDSSAVAVSVLGLMPGEAPLVSYTAVPEPGWDGRTFGRGWQGDESAPVRALGAMYPRLQLNFVDFSAGASVTSQLDQLLLLAEAPPRNIGNLHWGMDIAQAARAAGKRVLLDGSAGNATISLSGSSRFPALLRQGRFGELSRQLRADAKPGQFANGLFGKAILPLLPSRLHRAVREWRGALPQDRRHWSAIHPDFAREMDVDRRTAEAGFAGFRAPLSHRALVRQILFSGAFEEGQAVQHALQTLSGVQFRAPLADRRLLDFCLGLPSEQLLHDGVDRRLVRRVMAGRLPPAILDAPRGRQAADWHARMTRDLAGYRREIEAMAGDPDTSRQIDVPRLLRLIDDWPARTPLTRGDHPEYLMAFVGLGRAIGTGRFIRWVKGTNA